MAEVYVEVFDTKAAADTRAQVLKSPPLSCSDVEVVKADDLTITVPDSKPSVIARQNKYVVLAK